MAVRPNYAEAERNASSLVLPRRNSINGRQAKYTQKPSAMQTFINIKPLTILSGVIFMTCVFVTCLLCSGTAAAQDDMDQETMSPETKAQEESRQMRFAVTEYSANFLREKPDFAAELGNQLLMGTPVTILAEEGYWRLVLSPDPYMAWCVDRGLTEMTELELKEYLKAPKYICTALYSQIYTCPDRSSEKVSDLVAGDLMLNAGKAAKGFVRILLPSGKEGFVPKKDVEDFAGWAAKAKADSKSILSTAEQLLGVPYMWGGTSVKGLDCSGFTRLVWLLNGVLLPRNASQQALTGKEVPPTQEYLAPGDLLFFGRDGIVTHVGIYAGEGRFIHASGSVRRSSLNPGDPDYYELSDRLMSARRVIGEEDMESGVVSIRRSAAYFPQEDEQEDRQFD